jgi:hypothetical protein
MKSYKKRKKKDKITPIFAKPPISSAIEYDLLVHI